MTGRSNVAVIVLAVFLLSAPWISAFVPSSFSRTWHDRHSCRQDDPMIFHESRAFSVSMRMAGFFDDIGKFFDEMGSNKNNDRNNGDDNDNDDGQEMGCTRILSIPVKTIKPGGLRLLLMFYLMGMQNTPERGSWRADQPCREEYAVDMYFHDMTAALMVRLSDTQVTIDRMGSVPSMSYMMQESVIIDGILDELQACVFDGDIADDDRLLMLPEPKDHIEKARESLAFG